MGIMRRNVPALVEKEYDLIIVGGGIFGICAAWDAALRGLSVALLEKGDFAHAASGNCFKIVHGGLRYLQHADLYRIRESSYERSALLRIAPHLVWPLPLVIPTYGHAVKGKAAMKTGLFIYDLITADRNRGICDQQRQIPGGRIISRSETLGMFPGLKSEGLTGAAVFYDGQMHSPARLALCFLKSATKAGAHVANYTETTGLIKKDNRVIGVTATDLLTNNNFKVRGQVVLNAAGGWAERFLVNGTGRLTAPRFTFSRDTAFVVNRRMDWDYGLAVQGRTGDPDAVLSRGKRHLFIVPWRNYTLVGVWHGVHRGAPDEYTVTEKELEGYIEEINEAYPAFHLKLDEVSLLNAGLVLFGENRPGATDLSYGKRSVVIDHSEQGETEGLVTLVGVRYTTARGVAEKVINLVFKKIGKKSPVCKTAVTLIHGGEIGPYAEFIRNGMVQRPPSVRDDVMKSLLYSYGSDYEAVLDHVRTDPRWAEPLGHTTVIGAEVVHAVRREMAQKLGDVVFRRTELGTGEYPGHKALRQCSDIMAGELGWDVQRVETEIEEVTNQYPSHALDKVEGRDNEKVNAETSRT
jgi:glycerol-3-phosphate dehydrogenase